MFRQKSLEESYHLGPALEVGSSGNIRYCESLETQDVYVCKTVKRLEDLVSEEEIQVSLGSVHTYMSARLQFSFVCSNSE